MATSNPSSLKVTKVWPLEKYARFIPEEHGQVLPQKESTQKKAGDWKHYQSSRECCIQMSLLESNHLMISSGTQVYESFSLWNGQKWIKGVTKGDSILFIYKLNDQNRRFRVKFAQTSSHTTTEACKSCIISLAPLLPVREMDASSITSIPDSQVPSGYEDSQTLSQPASFAIQQTIPDSQPLASQESQALYVAQPELSNTSQSTMVRSNVEGGPHAITKETDKSISIPDIAKSMSEGSPLGLAYASTNFPTEQLGAFIRLCLTDSNFPAFVEAVEKEMNSIMHNNS